MDKKPWELNPAFTEERLVFLAKQLLEIRAAALALQQPEKGDSSWVLGCRVYEWQRYQLSVNALRGDYPSLAAGALTHRQFDVEVGRHRRDIFRGMSDDTDPRPILLR